MSAPGMKWEGMREQAARLGRVGMWAPGSYLCRCMACERQFEGDKRAMNCLPCAVERLDQIVSRLTVDGLAGVIRTALREHQSAPRPERGMRSEFVAQAILDYAHGAGR